MTKKSVFKNFALPGLLKPDLVVLACSFFCAIPTGYGSQVAVVSAIVGADPFAKLSNSCDSPRYDGKSEPVQPAEIGTYLRRTKNGWEDSSKWQIQRDPIRPQMDAIHPATWTLIVVGLVLLVLFGCSKQSEIDRLFADLDRYFGREKSDP